MRTFKNGTLCATALLWFCLPAMASTAAVDKDAQSEVIQSTSETMTDESGEASYNIEDCEAAADDEDANKAPEGGESTTPGGDVEQLDLDKCRSMKK